MLYFLKTKYLINKIIHLVFILWIMIVFSPAGFAQPANPDPCKLDPNADGCPPGSGDIDLPLDREVWILVIAGMLYGLKKIGDKRKLSQEC